VPDSTKESLSYQLSKDTGSKSDKDKDKDGSSSTSVDTLA
jgi:hypothetical protein